LVGSLKAVGERQWSVDDFKQALSRCDRRQAVKTAPAQGLVLTAVGYDNEDE
jgi:tRNA pseudouridine38-40 synthase